MFATHASPNRLMTPKYRAPGSDHWDEISWEDAVDRIARKIRKTRDATVAQPRLRAKPAVLFAGALLVVLGVVFNRVNVVVLAMDLRGAMPQNAPEGYAPSIFEWGISVGLIAATIFLYGLGARLLPLLPREQVGQAE